MKLILALLTLGLLAIAIACSDTDDSPAATDAPDSTAIPVATNTASAPTPQLSGCPIDDIGFCEVADKIAVALPAGDVDVVLANSRLTIVECAGDEPFGQGIPGPCTGRPAGPFSYYITGIDQTDAASFLTEDEYLELLEEIASGADPSASDAFGDGSWRVAAVLDLERLVLVTTTIGPDTIIGQPGSSRRIYTIPMERVDDAWQVIALFANPFGEDDLTGLLPDGSPNEDWLPWGEE